MDTTQNHYAEGKEARYKRVHTAWSQLYEILENKNWFTMTESTSVVA